MCAGETVETFVGFFTTASTEGEVLFELVKKVILNLELKLEDIVGECFDVATNMSGVRKRLATRMLSFCRICPLLRSFLRNFALQDSTTTIESAGNALGTIQKLYTFLEASPKRHRTFQDLEVEVVT